MVIRQKTSEQGRSAVNVLERSAPPQMDHVDQELAGVLGDPARGPGLLPTAYDTAWLASVPSPADPARPRFPMALMWLQSNQKQDGSWGGAVQYEHDRILSTLAALPAFVRFQRDAKDVKRVETGARYLWQREHLLRGEAVELVGFEVLLPALVSRVRQAGIPVPACLDIYGSERVEKLKLIPPDALYSPWTTLAHSLEFLGERVDVERLAGAQAVNGSIGNSPAATAFFLSLKEDAGAEAYLSDALERHGGESVPVLYPCDVFELTWAAYQWHLAGAPASSVLTNAQVEHLRGALDDGGVCLSPSFPIPDADETSVALVLLDGLGETVDPSVLERFATPEGHFASFPFERHSSVGVNLHVLHALLRVPGYPNAARTMRTLIDYLADNQRNGQYWYDKWHISPYYATSHALSVFEELPEEWSGPLAERIENAREWLRNTQNADGSWGFYGPATLEETAYGVLGLAASYPNISQEDRERCAAGARNIETRIRTAGGLCDALMPPLWIDKCLYTPTLVVKAAVRSALMTATKLAAG